MIKSSVQHATMLEKVASDTESFAVIFSPSPGSSSIAGTTCHILAFTFFSCIDDAILFTKIKEVTTKFCIKYYN